MFSNIGGALAEINLPVKSDKHENSLVRSTPQDQKYELSESKHSMFPAHSFASSSAKSAEAKQGGYYPLIRRSVDPIHTNPRYYAFNLVSDYPGFSEQSYTVKQHSNDKITFELNQNYRKIIKTFTLDSSSPYGFNVDIKVDGDQRNLWVTTGVPENEPGASQQQPILKYRHLKNNKFDIAKQKLPKTTNENSDVAPDWISNSNGFFSILVDPQTKLGKGYRVNKISGDTLTSRIDVDAPAKKRQAGYEFLLPLSQTSSDTELKVFAGPLENKALKQAQGENSTSNYLGAQSYHGFLPIISEPCAKLLFVLMNAIHTITHSWGLSIILLTVLLRVILYPLNSWSIRSMRKNQEIAPEISAIQKKYKKNPKQAQIETMQLYRKRKVNPLTGCLPMLIQMPFLIGMFSLLRSAFVLRGVSFIPGWITNLTAPDVLFSWTTSIPFIGTEFHLLPIISGIMIWVQQRMTTVMPTDKSLMTDQQKQQKMIGNMMVLFISLVCYNMPSGLNLYWISASMLGILQQWITNRILDKKKKKPTILVNKKTAIKES
ncbi:MAG: Membrane protein insertase YidC [Chlamydiae bacterium]|nr:Membrane protein insertase YidC [Chlamydiota bacterium]